MFRNILLVLLACLAFLPACRDGQRGLDMLYTDFFSIQSGANTLDTHYFRSGIRSVNWEEFLGQTQPGEVRQIVPSFARISNNDGFDLGFIAQAVLQVYPDQDITAQPQLEVAFRNDIPLNTGNSLNLIPSLPDFKEEFLDGEFVFRVGLRYRQVPTANIPIVLDFGFEAFVE